jgi:acetyl-CoA acyltransferase
MTIAPTGRRVAVISGVRTPFLKAGSAFRDVSPVALARYVAKELLYRTELRGDEVDEVIFGQVVPSVLAPNVAREVSLLPQFPRTVAQAITSGHDQIVLGHADAVLAGGVESLSQVPILHSRRFSDILIQASKARSLGGRLGAFLKVRPRDLIPVSPAIAEPSTGKTMGQSAEKMAKPAGGRGDGRRPVDR